MAPLLDELFRYVGFDEQDGARLVAASDALEPSFQGIVDEFYVAIDGNREARAVFEDEAQVARQKGLLLAWLRRFFAGPYDDSYLEERSRIGRAHVRIRLPQRYVFVSMNIIRAGLTRAVWALDDPQLDKIALLQSIQRLCDVELAIMLETYREDYDRALRTAERLATLGQFAGTLAHEMRNPLAVLSTSSHLLRRHAGDDPGVVRHVDRIERQVAVCGQIVDDLLALARDSPPRFEPVDLASVIEFAWAQLTKPEHTLDVTVAPDAGSVPADESQLRQVLVNLMENATQAMTEGGAVEVQVARCTLTRPGEEVDAVRIRIEDSGAGFTPEALEHLFEPLFTTKARGIGLGLPLCHRIVTKHHGRLSASNRSPRGARLDIVLPLAQKGMS
ncbi:MAG: histidine kinase [Sandaracinaceae bacterium]|nr:histidine kinase [Sandaracinaceae bacterium]